MSAPQTNVDKQIRRHRGPLFGISLALIFAGILFVAFLAWTSYAASPDAPQNPEIIVDS